MGAKSLETLVGAVVLVVAGLFFVFAYTKADVTNVSGYSVYAEFSNVGALKTGDDVKIAGIKVGTVTEMELDSDWYVAKVRMSIRPGVTLTDDTFVSIAPESLLGGNYIALQPGSGAPAEDGHVFDRTQSAIDLMDMISRALFGDIFFN